MQDLRPGTGFCRPSLGDIIDVHHERVGFDRAESLKHIEGIHDNLTKVFERARKEERPTGEVADAIAEERFKR